MRPIRSSSDEEAGEQSFVVVGAAVASGFLSISAIDMTPDAPPPSFRIRPWWCRRYLAVDRPAMPPPRMITRCRCPDEGSPSPPRGKDGEGEGAAEEATAAAQCILRDDRNAALASVAHSGACLRMGCVASDSLANAIILVAAAWSSLL